MHALCNLPIGPLGHPLCGLAALGGKCFPKKHAGGNELFTIWRSYLANSLNSQLIFISTRTSDKPCKHHCSHLSLSGAPI